MAITAVRAVRNTIPASSYTVVNQEQPNDTGGKGHAITLSGGEVKACNIWIPWCVSQADFDNHHKILIFPVWAGSSNLPPRFAVWQQGDYVRYSRDGTFISNGPLVHGNCIAGGDRTIEIVGADIHQADLRFF